MKVSKKRDVIVLKFQLLSVKSRQKKNIKKLLDKFKWMIIMLRLRKLLTLLLKREVDLKVS